MQWSKRGDRGKLLEVEKYMSQSEQVIKRKVLNDANRISLLAIMGMNRHERRALAKLNDIKKIAGKNTPYAKSKREEAQAAK